MQDVLWKVVLNMTIREAIYIKSEFRRSRLNKLKILSIATGPGIQQKIVL